ncbi:MAG: TRAP transporter substrate-binding protein [Rhodobacteraceae bacterium]|nr:TRAP transporter substrate-binding protein [Paracoccaceae bacterium]
MDRRSFLKKSALGGGAAAAGALAAPAIAQGAPRTLVMVTTWPRGLAGVWDAVEHFSDSVAGLTGGQLLIDAKGAGELVGALESFDAVTSGQADMYHAADYYWVNQSPAWAIFTTVPFGMTAPEMMTWYYGQGGAAKHAELGEIFGIRPFIAGQTGAQGGGWFRRQINAPEDFQGLKFRMPGLGGKVLGELGASVQNLPAGEIYQALSTGALDGTEWVGPWSDERLGLQEVCEYFYPAGFHEPGSALSVGVNLEVFDSLSPEQQKAIEIAAAETHQQNYALFIANNGPALKRLVAGGTKIQEFAPAIWDAFGTASRNVLSAFMEDEMFASIFESAANGMAESSNWVALSDGYYTQQRNRVLAAL